MEKKKLTEIARSKTNTLSAYDEMMTFAHSLHCHDGKHYVVEINWKANCVILYREVM